MKVTVKPTVLLERFPYRYVQVGTLEINGLPDCRIQKVDSYKKGWSFNHPTIGLYMHATCSFTGNKKPGGR